MVVRTLFVMKKQISMRIWGHLCSIPWHLLQRQPLLLFAGPINDHFAGPINDHFAHCESLANYFSTFFDDNIQKNVLHQIKLYMTQNTKPVPPVTSQGLPGINVIMGYHELASWRNFQSSDPALTLPFVSTALPRHRFAQFQQIFM